MTCPTSLFSNTMDQDFLEPAIQTAGRRIPPLWPLSHFVAVNPFLGWTDHHFRDVAHQLPSIAHGDIFLPPSYYLEQIEAGRITPLDLDAALRSEPGHLPGRSVSSSPIADLGSLISALQKQSGAPKNEQILTFAEHLDQKDGSSWNTLIVEEISKWCSVYYDQGQSSWQMPWRNLPLWRAWRQAAQRDLNPELCGFKEFRRFVQGLPDDPNTAIQESIEILGISKESITPFLHRQWMTLSGWSSYVQFLVREKSMAGQTDESLISLLAIRLSYDRALRQQFLGVANSEAAWKDQIQKTVGVSTAPVPGTMARYVAMKALENSYQRELVGKLRSSAPSTRIATARKQLQAVFCIDVRSEIFRRALEAQSDQVETIGFAGFFGVAVEYIPLGQSHGRAQCPVLLTPKFQIREGLTGAETGAEQKALARKNLGQSLSEAWRSFQTSAVSCFSFVETAGLGYGIKLVREMVASQGSSIHLPDDPAPNPLGPQIGKVPSTPVCRRPTGLDETEQLELAAGALRNMGLTRNFARLVLVCGHGSTSNNNPYASALDCGACGGHSGDVNARVAARILNRSSVRKGLLERGIRIPEDTLFLAGLHNTTTDEVELFDLEDLNPGDAAQVAVARDWLTLASRQCRGERALSMDLSAGSPSTIDLEVVARSQDWAQVRPEWGLAGNAAFIAAPRERTKQLNLGGRTFLHDYDSSRDPDLTILTLIMTAPMVVASWINLQYYASTVNNRVFGSGNKVIHNVVGTFGIWQGNGGDLQTGLPLQSLHDGQDWRHEPIRLTVILEARRQDIQQVMNAHASVRELVENGWVLLIALEPDSHRPWRAVGEGQWEELLLPTAPSA